MNIKKEIGKRIHEARKEKGLTLKALGKLAGDFKQTRLTNWEQGIRTPGPEEIKQLAHILEVSPAFLMCLSDDKQLKPLKKVNQLVPLFNHQQAGDKNLHIDVTQHKKNNDFIFIAISTILLPRLSVKAFALKMIDDSMEPAIAINDILVIDPEVSPMPGNYVAVKVSVNPEVMICQYKKLSYTAHGFELLTLNANWPNISSNENMQIDIVGRIMQIIRAC